MTSTIDTSSNYYSTYVTMQRKGFHANGRFWEFYSNGTSIKCKTSTDGITWDTNSWTHDNGTEGMDFSVAFDGTYFHYVFGYYETAGPLQYRRGLPNADGSFTWSQDEQIIVVSCSNGARAPTIAIDSSGRPIICYLDGLDYKVSMSSTSDGTWSSASGFPKILLTNVSAALNVVTLTNNKWYVVYCLDYGQIKGKLWDGNALGNEEVVSTSDVGTSFGFSGMCADGDDVHLVFCQNSTWGIIYVKRTYGVGWSSETSVVDSHTSERGPALTIKLADHVLYCFWYGSSTHIYYKKCDATTGTWDTNATDWKTVSSMPVKHTISSFYSVLDGWIGVIYVTSTTYNVKFESLLDPPTLPTGKIFLIDKDNNLFRSNPSDLTEEKTISVA